MKKHFLTSFTGFVTHRAICLICILMITTMGSLRAQQDKNYAVYANIIYHFTKYINWPDNKKSGDFIIEVIGDPPFFDALKQFTANRSVGDQKIQVKKYSSSETPDRCHILFISEESSGCLKKIVSQTAKEPILIVTESDGLSRRGGCINFIIVDEHLKLEINKTNIEQRNLNVATELLSLGVVVK